jgi:hypothetical protein
MTFDNKIILSVIIILAASLRLYGINFEIPHPDDYITVQAAMHFGPAGVELRGYGIYGLYVWPAVPMVYLNIVLFSAYFLAGKLIGFFPDMHSFGIAFLRDPSAFYLIARIAAVAFSIGTIFLLYKIAERLYNRNIALTAALFLSVSFIHSLHSQFIRPDIPSLLVTLMVFMACFAILETGRTRYYILAGILAGLAVGIKFTSGIVVFVIIAAHLFRIFENRDLRQRAPAAGHISNLIILFGIMLVLSGILMRLDVFVKISDFSFSDDGFFNSRIIEAIYSILTLAIISGVLLIVWGVAVKYVSPLTELVYSFFEDRKIIFTAIATFVSFAVFDPVFFLDIKNQIRIFLTDANYFGRAEDSWFVGVGSLGFWGNLWWYISGPVFWGAGGVIALLAVPGIIKGVVRRKKEEYLFFLYFLLYTILISFGRMRWERYAVTLMPFVALYAALFADTLITWTVKRNLERRRIFVTGIFLAIIVLPNIYDILRYDYLLTQKDTRTVASEWVVGNIPSGARIGQDAYTGKLPPERYVITSKFSLGDKSLEYYIRSGFDYLIVSDIQYMRYIREAGKLPVYSEFYKNLFSYGILVQEIKPDGGLWPPPEERFTKYHIHVSPTIRIYKISPKVRRMS